MRRLGDLRALLGLLLAVLPACAKDEQREATARVAQALTGDLSVTSGANGTVTTLASYGGGAAHPGVNAVDIAAPGGTGVWHQLDYLPADIAGGWVRTIVTKDAGYCSQWSPGSPYYNGAKVIVVTYFYGTDGTYRGWHRSAYQHVAPDATAADHWWPWNNANAGQKAWSASEVEVELGSGTSSGVYLGTVFGVWGNIYNGPGGGLCTTGSHLHQEGDGVRAGTLWLGKGLSERYSDVHRFGMESGWPSTGIPSTPSFDPPPPAPAPEPEPEPEPAEPAAPRRGDPPSSNGERADFDARLVRQWHKLEDEGAPPSSAHAPASAPLGEGALGDATGSAAEAGCSAGRSRSSEGALASMMIVIVGVGSMTRRRRRQARSTSNRALSASTTSIIIADAAAEATRRAGSRRAPPPRPART